MKPLKPGCGERRLASSEKHTSFWFLQTAHPHVLAQGPRLRVAQALIEQKAGRYTKSTGPLAHLWLGPPVERLEWGYPFSVVDFSRGTLAQKRGENGALLGGHSSGKSTNMLCSARTKLWEVNLVCPASTRALRGATRPRLKPATQPPGQLPGPPKLWPARPRACPNGVAVACTRNGGRGFSETWLVIFEHLEKSGADIIPKQVGHWCRGHMGPFGGLSCG